MRLCPNAIRLNATCFGGFPQVLSNNSSILKFQKHENSRLVKVTMEPSVAKVDRLVRLYPKVDEVETALPRSWSGKDKYTYIGLSQNNLRVHYKGTEDL